MKFLQNLSFNKFFGSLWGTRCNIQCPRNVQLEDYSIKCNLSDIAAAELILNNTRLMDCSQEFAALADFVETL